MTSSWKMLPVCGRTGLTYRAKSEKYLKGEKNLLDTCVDNNMGQGKSRLSNSS